MSVKLLTEHHLEFLSLKEDCTGSSESTHVKMPHCRKSLYMYFTLVVGKCTVSAACGCSRCKSKWGLLYRRLGINLGMGGRISVVLAADIVGWG